MKLIALAFLASLGLATADTITTTKGVVYEDVEIRETTPINVAIRHRDGTATLNFTDLDEAARAKLGYNSAKAAEYLKALAAEQAKQIAAQRKADSERRARSQRAQEKIEDYLYFYRNGGRLVYDPATDAVYFSHAEAAYARESALRAALNARRNVR